MPAPKDEKTYRKKAEALDNREKTPEAAAEAVLYALAAAEPEKGEM